jgi:hypothetical protein
MPTARDLIARVLTARRRRKRHATRAATASVARAPKATTLTTEDMLQQESAKNEDQDQLSFSSLVPSPAPLRCRLDRPCSVVDRLVCRVHVGLHPSKRDQGATRRILLPLPLLALLLRLARPSPLQHRAPRLQPSPRQERALRSGILSHGKIQTFTTRRSWKR